MIVCRLAAPRRNYLVHSLKRRRSVFQVQVVTFRKVFVFISCFCQTCFPLLGPYGHFDRDIGRRDRIRPPKQHNTTQHASDGSRERSCTKGEEPGLPRDSSLPPQWTTLVSDGVGEGQWRWTRTQANSKFHIQLIEKNRRFSKRKLYKSSGTEWKTFFFHSCLLNERHRKILFLSHSFTQFFLGLLLLPPQESLGELRSFFLFVCCFLETNAAKRLDYVADGLKSSAR